MSFTFIYALNASFRPGPKKYDQMIAEHLSYSYFYVFKERNRVNSWKENIFITFRIYIR